MPSKNKQWFKNYAVFYKDQPSRIEAIEELIAKIRNECNLSRSGALRSIFDAGVEAKAEDATYGTPSLKMSIAEARLFHALSLEVERQVERGRAYKILGPLGILDVAQRIGIESNEAKVVLDACRKAVGPERDLSPSHAYKVWITYHLQDGLEKKYSEIVEAAVEDEVLPSPETGETYERALSLFKQVGSNLKVSGGKRGWWKLPTRTIAVTEEDPF